METLVHSLDGYIDRLTTLPPAPVVLPRLPQLLGPSEVDSDRVVEVLGCDPNLTAAVWNHLNPAAAIGHEQTSALVYLGNLVAHFMGFGYGHQALALRGREDAPELAGLEARDLPRCMIATFDEFRALEGTVAVQP